MATEGHKVLARELAKCEDVESLVNCMVRECGFTAHYARNLLTKSISHVVPLSSKPQDEGCEARIERINQWKNGHPTDDFMTAVRRIEADPEAFFRAILPAPDSIHAQFEAAVQLSATKEVGWMISGVWLGMFCRDGIQHLLKYGAEWAEKPFHSTGWTQTTLYIPLSSHARNSESGDAREE